MKLVDLFHCLETDTTLVLSFGGRTELFWRSHRGPEDLQRTDSRLAGLSRGAALQTGGERPVSGGRTVSVRLLGRGGVEWSKN